MPESRFATTQWSLVLAAGGPRSPHAEEALADLCRRYWNPVFAFVRREGYSTDEAQDLTQGFFTRLIEKRDLGDADPARGRFRSFLLAACRHFVSNERDRARALKRGGGQVVLPIDAALDEAHGETPEQVYERQWTLALLAGVLDDLRDDYGRQGKARLFDRLRVFLTAEDSEGYASAAMDLDMTLAAVKVAIHRLRQRYRDALRRRVADTVASDAEIDDELRHLLKTVGGWQ